MGDGPRSRSLSIVDRASMKAETPDAEIAGDPGRWRLVCKASSVSQGWMKSTKVLDVPGGCLVQVTTEHRDQGRVVACAEALTFVPNATVAGLIEE